MKIEWKDRVASAGIVIGEKEHWGRGVGRDAMTTLARFAFDELNLHRIELQVLDDNERARRCYAACGFRCEGVRRQAIFRGGRYHDVTSMALLADERGERWRARAGAEQANGVEGRGLPAPNHVPE
jgi:RimJ/RimL family protein N-acetyltransferase